MSMRQELSSLAMFGQVLAFAERTMSEVLDKHLAERDIRPETWYAVKLAATQKPTRAALHRDLAGSRNMNADSARELLARLEAEGIIHGDTQIELTTEGEALFRELRDHVAASPTAALLTQLDADDLDTTVRTLQVVIDEVSKLRAA